MLETWVQSLDWEDLLEKGMAEDSFHILIPFLGGPSPSQGI